LTNVQEMNVVKRTQREKSCGFGMFLLCPDDASHSRVMICLLFTRVRGLKTEGIMRYFLRLNSLQLQRIDCLIFKQQNGSITNMICTIMNP